MKKEIKNIIKLDLIRNGYKELPVLIKNKRMLLYKETDKGMILSLAIEESKLYSSQITCSFYLAVSYSYPMATPTFLPGSAYKRIGTCLNQHDKKRLVNDKRYWYTADIWWDSSSKDDVLKFIEAITIGEHLFLSENKYILNDLMNVSKFPEYILYIKVLHNILIQLPSYISSCVEYENNVINDKLIELVRKVVKEKNDKRNNKEGIVFLSVDVWRCCIFSSTKNKKLIEEVAGVL